MRRMLTGQISTEVLILIGLMLLLLIPLLLFGFSRASVASEDFAVQKAEFAATRLARLADSVGYIGGAAAVVDEIEVPQHVKSIEIANGQDVVFNMDTTAGKKQIVKSTAFRIRSSGFDRITKSGTYFVEVRALSNFTEGADQVEMKVK